MKIVILNGQIAETEAIAKAIERAKHFAGDSEIYDHINIYAQPRVPADAPAYKHPGWLEYLICFYKDETESLSFTLAMVQRQPETEFEFHS